MENTVLRANLLGGMNEYILANVTDEKKLQTWSMYGVPDDCDEEELMEIAEEDFCFRTIARTFSELI